MTFGEILARVEFKIWGNSTPDTGSRTVLTGDEGIIANIHQQIQQDYNYWFMRATATITTIAGSQAYILPTNLKEIIRLIFKTHDESYFQNPLMPLGARDSVDSYWPINNGTAEYPTHFEFVDDNIVLYPSPSEARTLHVLYWKYFDRPTIAFIDSTSVETDDVTVNCHEALVNLACAEMCIIREEFSKAQIYQAMAGANLNTIKKKDSRKRQMFLSECLDYVGI